MPAVESRGVRLQYELSGCTTGPMLVLVNSLGASMQMWNKALPLLECDYHILRYDTRGHGLSSVPPPPYTIEQLGNDLLSLLDLLSIQRVHLCGLSLGGLVGLWLGMHAPQRIDRLILANTSARIGTKASWEERIAAVQKSGMASIAQTTLERWFTQEYLREHAAEMEQIRMMIESTPESGYIGCCTVLRDTDLRSDIAAIDAECLLITGRYDPATPPEDGLALNSALRNSSYTQLESSHLSAWERSEEFACATLDFLNGRSRING